MTTQESLNDIWETIEDDIPTREVMRVKSRLLMLTRDSLNYGVGKQMMIDQPEIKPLANEILSTPIDKLDFEKLLRMCFTLNIHLTQ